MLKVITFIKNHENWRELLTAEPYCLKIVEEDDYILLKYRQTESDFNEEIVRECRGLILDKYYTPVCVPFYKFGNYGESYAPQIDWKTAVVEEKVDGSLIKTWNHKGEWKISTNGAINANKTETQSDTTEIVSPYPTFGDLFKEAARRVNLDFEQLNPEYTYMFEPVSPYNRVIVPYSDIKIYHIGTRNNKTLQETEVDIGIQKPETYQAANLTDVIEMAGKLNYDEEGYVVRDSQYQRVKIKSPAYVAMQHMIQGKGEAWLLSLILKNETDEFLTYFPDYADKAKILQKKIDDLEKYTQGIIKDKLTGRTYASRREAAEIITATKYPAFFFMYHDGKVKSATEWLNSMTINKALMQLDKN